MGIPSVLKKCGVAAMPGPDRNVPRSVIGLSVVEKLNDCVPDDPKGTPVEIAALSTSGSFFNSPSRRSTTRLARSSFHCCRQKFIVASDSRSRSTPESWRASAKVYRTHKAARMKNPVEMATCQRTSERCRFAFGAPTVPDVVPISGRRSRSRVN